MFSVSPWLLLARWFRRRPGGLAQIFPGRILRRQTCGTAPDDRAAGRLADAVAAPDDRVRPRLRVGPHEIAAGAGRRGPRRRAAPDDGAAPGGLVVVD